MREIRTSGSVGGVGAGLAHAYPTRAWERAGDPNGWGKEPGRAVARAVAGGVKRGAEGEDDGGEGVRGQNHAPADRQGAAGSRKRRPPQAERSANRTCGGSRAGAMVRAVEGRWRCWRMARTTEGSVT